MDNPKISLADFNTILLHAEKISHGQLDFISTLRGELKSKLGVEDAAPLIDSLKTTDAADVHNSTRLLLSQFNLIIEGDNVTYRLVKLNDNYCELDPIKTDDNDAPQKFYRYFFKSTRPIFGGCPSDYVKADKNPVVIRGITKFFASVYYKSPLTDKNILDYDLEPDINNPVTFDTPPAYNLYKKKKQSAENVAPVEGTVNSTLPVLSGTNLNFEVIFAPPSAGTIEELTLLFKNDMEQSNIFFRQSLIYYIKTGIDLIAIREKLQPTYGAFGDWLKANNLKRQTAYDYIAAAEWFLEMSKEQLVRISVQLTPGIFFELTKLSHEDAFNFIEAKAAEGTPVENMTVKQLRADIKKYKAAAAKTEAELQRLQKYHQDIVIQQEHFKESTERDAAALRESNEQLRAENEQLKNQPPQVVEITKEIVPADYESTKQTAAELQSRVAELQAQGEESQKTIEDLQNQVIEAVSKQGEPKIEYVSDTPADYQELQKKLADAQEKLYVAQKDAEDARAIVAAEKYIEQLFQSAAALTNSVYYHVAMGNYIKKHRDCDIKLEQLRLIHEQLAASYEIISGETK